MAPKSRPAAEMQGGRGRGRGRRSRWSNKERGRSNLPAENNGHRRSSSSGGRARRQQRGSHSNAHRRSASMGPEPSAFSRGRVEYRLPSALAGETASYYNAQVRASEFDGWRSPAQTVKAEQDQGCKRKRQPADGSPDSKAPLKENKDAKEVHGSDEAGPSEIKAEDWTPSAKLLQKMAAADGRRAAGIRIEEPKAEETRQDKPVPPIKSKDKGKEKMSDAEGEQPRKKSKGKQSEVVSEAEVKPDAEEEEKKKKKRLPGDLGEAAQHRKKKEKAPPTNADKGERRKPVAEAVQVERKNQKDAADIKEAAKTEQRKKKKVQKPEESAGETASKKEEAGECLCAGGVCPGCSRPVRRRKRAAENLATENAPPAADEGVRGAEEAVPEADGQVGATSGLRVASAEFRREAERVLGVSLATGVPQYIQQFSFIGVGFSGKSNKSMVCPNVLICYEPGSKRATDGAVFQQLLERPARRRPGNMGAFRFRDVDWGDQGPPALDQEKAAQSLTNVDRVIPLIRSSRVEETYELRSLGVIGGFSRRKTRNAYFGPAPDRHLVSCGLDGVFNFFKVENEMEHLRSVKMPGQVYPEDFAWHPSGTSVFAAFGKQNNGSQVGIVSAVGEVPQGQDAITWLDEQPHSQDLCSIEFMPWSREPVFVTTGADHAVVLWREEEDDWKPRHLYSHSSSVYAATGVPHKDWIISAGMDRRCVIYDVTASCFHSPNDHKSKLEDRLLGVYVNPVDPNLLLVQSSSNSKQLLLYDIRMDMEATAPFELGWKGDRAGSQSGQVFADWSPCGLKISLGSRGPSYFVFDIRSGTGGYTTVTAVVKRSTLKAVWHPLESDTVVAVSTETNIGMYKFERSAV